MAEPGRFTRYPLWRRWFGRRSERAAVKYLKRQRFRILGVNLEDARGEIDVLALDGGTLVVVEVRSTEQADLRTVLESVNYEKQKRLTNAVTRHLGRKRLLGKINVRFDILAVSWPHGAKAPRIEHVRDAFQAVGRFQMFN